MKSLIVLLVSLALAACSQGQSDIERHQPERNNVVDVSKEIKVIGFEDLIANRFAYIKVLGNYIVITDLRSPDKLIHIYDKSSFTHMGDTGCLGQGPGEISSIGPVTYDSRNNSLYVSDYGSMNIYSYSINEAVNDSLYLPEVKYKLNRGIEPVEYVYLNDSLSYGCFSVSSSSDSYREVCGKMNHQTGSVQIHNYEYPDLRVYRNVFDYSIKHNLIVECSTRYDLITMLDGNLNMKCRIFGPQWNRNGDHRSHFKSVAFYKNYFIASYDGTKYEERNKPTICHVFDIEGNYIKTLDVGFRIWRISADEDNDRLYFTFDDEIQFGYLDLKGLL